jgi:hypothetical protein
VNYRPWLEESALRQMGRLPEEALVTLVRLMVRVCEDPYERLQSVAVTDDPCERMAELGELGFVEFRVDEAASLIRVYSLVWMGALSFVATYVIDRARLDVAARAAGGRQAVG